MLRKNHAAQLLRAGLPPSEIARQMGTSTAAVLQYLCLKIGEGELRRSDIAFSLGHELRAAIEESIAKTGSLNGSVIARELRTGESKRTDMILESISNIVMLGLCWETCTSYYAPSR